MYGIIINKPTTKMTKLNNREQVKDRIELFSNQLLRLANIYSSIYKVDVRDKRLYRVNHLTCRAITQKRELQNYLKVGFSK